MSPAEILRYQIRFTTWVTTRVLEAATALSAQELHHDFATADKSILGTLAHIYRSEHVWLARIEGRPRELASEGDDELSFLLERWPVERNAWQTWSDSLTDADCGRTLTYQDLKNRTWTNSLTEIVLHAVNHASHHRGQVSGFLRSLGKIPPSVDSILFARGLRASS